MIKLANEAERKSKLAKSNGPQKVATINLSEKWINWLLIALLAFQVFLNIAAYNASLTGMKNISLFFIGVILLVFAAFFHVYRYAMSQQKNAPPPPPALVPDEIPKLVESDVPKPSELDVPKPSELDVPKPSELDKDVSGEKSEPKELSDIPTPKVQADVKVDANNNTNLGSEDLKKP
jgi:ubiquinol-cytochrome c reductase cytochrome b subunit